MIALDMLAGVVQHNCHVADARHAADLSLCNYLLQMREFFRWERGLALGTLLPRAEVGAWIAEREALWSDLEGQGYAPLPLPGAGGAAIAPFDAEAVNACLQPQGLLYGAGLVARDRPVFFLAALERSGTRDGLNVLQAGREYARTLLAPPAALAGGGAGPIVLRRESLARWCWERAEAFAMRPVAGSALHAMLRDYGLDRDFHAALPRWLDEQCETAVLHEIGEYRAGGLLGPGWSAMRAALPDARAEALARAVRDHLADLSVTLPTLLERQAPGPLHAWFAAYDGLREALCPGLPRAYAGWRAGDGGRTLRAHMAHARRHFETLAQDLLALWSADGEAAAARIAQRLAPAQAVCGVAGID